MYHFSHNLRASSLKANFRFTILRHSRLVGWLVLLEAFGGKSSAQELHVVIVYDLTGAAKPSGCREFFRTYLSKGAG